MILYFSKLLRNNWTLQEVRRMGTNLAKGEGFFIEVSMPRCIPEHSSSSRASAGRGRGSCLSYCIIICPSQKPAFLTKVLITWHGHTNGKMLWQLSLQVAFFSSPLTFAVLFTLLVGGTGLISLVLLIPLLLQHSHAMASLWQEALRGRTHVYNTSWCNRHLHNVHSY